MTEPWIRVHANLVAKPVVWRAVDALGVPVNEAIGLLVRLWGAVSIYGRRGDLSDVSNSQIEGWAGWTRKRGKFAAFVRAQHLDADGRIREWDAYAGPLDDRRERKESPDGRTTFVFFAVDGEVVKIGWSGNPWARTADLRGAHPKISLAAIERGSRELEAERLAQFADAQLGSNWFKLSEALRAHIARLAEAAKATKSASSVARSVATTDATTDHATACTTDAPTITKTLTTTRSTKTDSIVADVGARDGIAGLAVDPRRLTALNLVVWSNRAITEHWGEQPSPLTRGTHATDLAEELRAIAADPETVRKSIYDQCRRSKNERPPRTVSYFRDGILEAWRQEQARRDLSASGESPPPRAAARQHGNGRMSPGEQQLANILGPRSAGGRR